ncbi:MAG TPA: hypothetical protein VMU33_10460 [Burkholderiaceae bacterium]|nr:hypothetical protein [Burkholderiaceae bacterium]
MRPAVILAIVRDVAQRLGAPGVAASVLLVVALVLGAVVGPRLAADNRAVSARIAELQARGPAGGAAATGTPFDPLDPAAALVEQLPAADRFPAFVDALQAEASRRGVAVDRTEYRMQPLVGQRVLRAQLVLPAHGGYVQVRGWLEAVLHDFPSASVQELALHRVADGAGDVDARVVLAFYTRSAN